MKKVVPIFFLLIISIFSFAQAKIEKPKKEVAATLGILQGGGSVLGVDFEAQLEKGLGLQVGAGLLGYGFGCNFHFKPTLNSSFISLQYWHQGAQSSYTQSIFGPAYVFRAKKIFTAQLGAAYRLGEGPALPTKYENQKFMLTYAIGIFKVF